MHWQLETASVKAGLMIPSIGLLLCSHAAQTVILSNSQLSEEQIQIVKNKTYQTSEATAEAKENELFHSRDCINAVSLQQWMSRKEV